jgi:hypothetical protein
LRSALVRKPPFCWTLQLAFRPSFADGMTTLVGILVLTLASCSHPVTPPSNSPVSIQGPLPVGTYPEKPLAAGSKAPDFAAAGWLNGHPPPTGSAGIQLTVLDIWANW